MRNVAFQAETVLQNELYGLDVEGVVINDEDLVAAVGQRFRDNFLVGGFVIGDLEYVALQRLDVICDDVLGA